MERKQFSFNFSMPSFLKRVKTEDSGNEIPPGSPSVETRKSDQLSRDHYHQASNPFRLTSNRVPPSVGESRMDVFTTPRRPVTSNTLPQSNTPRPSAHHVGRGGFESPRPCLLDLKRRSIQTVSSSSEDIQAKESSMPKTTAGTPLENGRKKMTVSPKCTIPFRLNIAPGPSPLNRKSSASLASVTSFEEQILPTESTTFDQGLNAAFAMEGDSFNSTFDLVKTNDSKNRVAVDESVNYPVEFTTDDYEQEQEKLTFDRELKELRLKLSNTEKHNSDLISELEELRMKLSNTENHSSDLISENSTLKSELEKTSSRTVQFETECKGLADRLLEREEAVKVLTHQNGILTDELTHCKVEKMDTEVEVTKLKEEVDALGRQLREGDASLEAQETEKEILNRQLQEAIEKISVGEATINSYVMERTSLENDISELRNQISKAINEREELRATIAESEDESFKLTAEIANLRLDLQEVIAECKRKLDEEKLSHDSTKAALEEAKTMASVLQLDLEKNVKEHQRELEEERLSHEITKAALDEAKAKVSVLEANFEQAVEDYQRKLEEEKLSHETTRAVLEEAKARALVLKADFEKSNESFLQLQMNTDKLADEKFTLDTRVHTLENELRICETALNNSLDNASSLEASQSKAGTLLEELKAKLELTQAELNQTKVALSELSKAKVKFEGKASLGSSLKPLGDDLKQSVTDGSVPAVDIRSRSPRLEDTHFVNCSPDMFENDTCYSCHSIKGALQAPKPATNAVVPRNVEKCGVCQALLKAIEQSATSSVSHNALLRMLEEFNSNPTKDDVDRINISAYNSDSMEDHGSQIVLREGEPTSKQFQEVYSFARKVAKTSGDDYAQAISMVGELFNDVKVLTKKCENTRSFVESVVLELTAYKNQAYELLNSVSVSQKEKVRELNEKVNSLRQELQSAEANVLALKHRNEESEKIIQIFNEKMAELETNKLIAENQSKAAMESETKLLTAVTSLEQELLDARSQLNSRDSKIIEIYKEKLAEMEINLRAAEDKLQKMMESESKLQRMNASLEKELLATRDSHDTDCSQIAKALTDIKECQRQLNSEQAANKAAAASVADYREKLKAAKSELDAKVLKLKEKEALLKKQENRIQSLNKSVDIKDQSYQAAQEKIKSIEFLLENQKREVSSLNHKLNLANAANIKIREQLTKSQCEKGKLEREVETLWTRVAALEKPCECQLNRSINATEDQQAPRPSEGEHVEEEQESVKEPMKEVVNISSPEESCKNPAATSARMKKRLRTVSPSLKVKQEPTLEVASPKKFKKAIEYSVASQGKGGKQKESAVTVNDDDEFEPVSAVAPVKRTYTRAGAKATSTPKADRTNRQSSSVLKNTSGSNRKRTKTAP